MKRITIISLLLIVLPVWVYFLATTNQHLAAEDINYFDVISEVFTISFIILMALINIKLASDTRESRMLFAGVCFLLIGHTHDLADEFFYIQPEIIALILENIANNLGFVIIAFAVVKWSDRYRGQLLTLEIQKKELTSVSQTDPLTKLLNRRTLNEQFKHQAERSAKQGQAYTLLLVDLDNFKQFNDNFGHMAGDRLIQHAADVIRDMIRGDDFAFRYGGEEFLIILQADLGIARDIAERLRNAYESSEFQVDGTQVEKTLSAGLVELVADVKFDNALNIADEAMYSAKSKGKNCVVVAKAIDK